MTLVLVTHDQSLAARCERRSRCDPGASRQPRRWRFPLECLWRRRCASPSRLLRCARCAAVCRASYIFLTCIALGVAAIGGVNSVARSITAGIAEEGQSLLGGDIRFELNQRQATAAERPSWTDWARSGQAPTCARWRGCATDPTRRWSRRRRSTPPIRSMARLVTEPALTRGRAVGEKDGVYGAAAPDLLFERLAIRPGARIKLGTATFELRGEDRHRARRGSDGIGFAPRLMMSLDGLAASGLVQPGSLVEHVYKLRLAGQPSEAELTTCARAPAALPRGRMDDPNTATTPRRASSATSSASRSS